MLTCKFILDPPSPDNSDTNRARRRPRSRTGLTWDFSIYDDWLTEDIYVKYYTKKGKDDWCKMVTRYIDYLVDPSIETKHREVFDAFINYYLPFLEQEGEDRKVVFRACQHRIAQLREECYEGKVVALNKQEEEAFCYL